MTLFTNMQAVRSVAKNFGHRLSSFQSYARPFGPKMGERVYWAECSRCGARCGFCLSTPVVYRTSQIERPCGDVRHERNSAIIAPTTPKEAAC